MFRRRKRSQGDFSAELQSHIDLETDRLRMEGLSEEEARTRARQSFGNMMNCEERFYESSRTLWLDHLRQDIGYTVRQLARSKAFAFLAVATLALGIGVNTAIFTLIHAVMFNTLPVYKSTELYRLGRGNNCCVMTGYQNGQDFALFSYDLYRTLRDGTPEIQHLAAFQAAPWTVTVRRAGASQLTRTYATECVSSNYFDLFGISPATGHFFGASNDVRANAMVAVVSYRVWEAHYGRDAAVIGSTFLIKGKPFTIIGVAPPGFYGETLRTDPPDFWMPLAAEPVVQGSNNLFDRPGKLWLYVMGRLPASASVRPIELKINAEARRWFYGLAGSQLSAKDRRDIDEQFIPVTRAAGGIDSMSMAYHDALLILMSLSSLVLLTACANVANLLLARGTTLRAQVSLRLALGASRGRVTRQSLTESVLVSILGGAAGLELAFATTRLILSLAFHGARYVPISAMPSPPVLGFALAISVATGLLFGIWPAWMQTHSDPVDALRGATRSTPASATLPQRVLVVGQAALSLMLLVGTGLLSRSLLNLEHQHFGFQTRDRVLVSVDPAVTHYTEEQLAGTYRRLQTELSGIPGVVSVSLSQYAPMTWVNWNDLIWVQGRATDRPLVASYVYVSPGYFDTIGTRLLRGRLITQEDRESSPRVAVVSQAFAKLFFPNQNPLGKRFGMGVAAHAADYEIVGLVEDTKYTNPQEDARPTFFVPLFQMGKNPDGSLSGDDFINDIVLHVRPNAGNIEPAIRKIVEQVDPNISVLDVRRYDTQLSLMFNHERLIATLTQLFGLLALALATVGLYGLVTLSVARRTAEIGVRIALGATRERVVAMILRAAVLQVGLGLVIGIPVTLACVRLIRSQLFGISTHDPFTIAGAAAVLGGCAILAAFVPARRAARLDPMLALRND